MTHSFYIGIDPGKAGGIAMIDYRKDVRAIPMPIGGREIDIKRVVDWLNDGSVLENCVVYFEKVTSMHNWGVKSTFTFGVGYGILHGIFGTLGIPRFVVTPHKWKSTVLAGTKKDKLAAIDYVNRTYPDISLLATSRSRKPHDGMADAICIATYGYLQDNNE